MWMGEMMQFLKIARNSIFVSKILITKGYLRPSYITKNITENTTSLSQKLMTKTDLQQTNKRNCIPSKMPDLQTHLRRRKDKQKHSKRLNVNEI